MYQVRHVANALLKRAELTDTCMSQLRLQKMLYFLHGCYSVWHNAPLLPEVFEVWQYGPAIDSILREYREGDSCIRECRADNQDMRISLSPPKSDLNFWSSLDMVWSTFSGYTDVQLADMAHCEGSPWEVMMKNGHLNSTIPQEMLLSYFKTITSQEAPAVKVKKDNIVHVDFRPR